MSGTAIFVHGRLTGSLQQTSRIRSQSSGMGPRILIVEDEENVAYVIGTALRLAGFAISETSSGRDASAARLRS